ncbi:MAG: hypothetical protein IPK82_38955 [Polyangiaceae bacterium]|nr:hypothetical protein [Polyangiaceae bacterium]
MNVVERQKIEPQGPGGTVSLVRVGPRGDHVAFVIPSGENAGIYTWDVSGGTRRVTALEQGSIDDLVWSPTGDHVAYLIGGGPPGSYGEIGWASTKAAGELGRTQGMSFAWTPKGNALIVADPAAKALVRKPLTGDSQVLTELADDFDPQNAPKIALSFDGALICTTVRRTADDVSEVLIVERTSKGLETKVLTQIPGASVIVRPLWAPRTPTIALYIVHLEQEKSAIVAVPRLEGEGIILYESDFIDPAERPAWSPTGRTIAFFGVEKAHNEFTKAGPARLFLLTEIASEKPILLPVSAPGEMVGGLSFVDEKKLAVDGGSEAFVLSFADVV